MQDRIPEDTYGTRSGSITGESHAGGSQAQPIAEPAAGGRSNNDELKELLAIESAGLQVAWGQHGDRSTALQLAANDKLATAG